MILVIDNFDSFTYNLVQYLGNCASPLPIEIKVVRNNEIDLSEIRQLKPAGILLSPGPCTPKESGVCLDICRYALDGGLGEVPLFGVCLGHEALGEVAGGEIVLAKAIRHGKASPIAHDKMGVFENMPNPFSAIRYHSLVIRKENLPSDFIVSATSLDDDEIMGIRHRTLPIEGVQFHPESVLTECGQLMIQNFVDQVYQSAVH